MGIVFSPVTGEKDLDLFLRLPALLRPESQVNKVPGRWVRPLLDRRKNPYFRHADHVLLLARRDGRPVGRVAVFVDHLCNRALREQVGCFGLFDTINSPRTAAQILESAEKWLIERGVFIARGPLGPAMRLGTGVLVEGHGQAPMPGMSFDPPELGPLIESARYEPKRDLYAYRLSTDPLPLPIVRAADAARHRTGLKLRPFDKKRFEEDIVIIQEVMNDLPDLGRACAPWTRDEVRWMAKKMWPVMDPFLVLLIEQHNIPIAVGLALRNVREALGGRSPRTSIRDSWQIAKALRLKRLRSARITLLAVRPQASQSDDDGDVTALLLTELLKRLRAFGVEWAEVSLVDPTDSPLVNVLEVAKGARYKTYRIYEKHLDQ